MGVIVNLALWFALHVFFARVDLIEGWGLRLWLPDATSLDWRVLAVAIVSGYLLLARHWNIALVLAASAGLSLIISHLHLIS